MHPDDIERLLAAEEMIEPSAGFADGVMRAVRGEAVAVAPIAFPWRRVLPGVVLAGAGLVAGLVLLGAALATAPAAGPPASPWTVPDWFGPRLEMLAVLVGTLLVAWLVVLLARESGETVL